jgi:hypothetical protein
LIEWNPRANELFLEAIEIQSAQRRQDFLEEKCGADAELRADVESLVAANRDVGSFLEEPVSRLLATVEISTVVERPGMLICPYKLLEQIGSCDDPPPGKLYLSSEHVELLQAILTGLRLSTLPTWCLSTKLAKSEPSHSLFPHFARARIWPNRL